MYVITLKHNNVNVTLKFRRSQHAIARAQEIALKQGKAGVKVVKQERHVRSYDGIIIGWRGAEKTYLIGTGTAPSAA